MYSGLSDIYRLAKKSNCVVSGTRMTLDIIGNWAMASSQLRDYFASLFMLNLPSLIIHATIRFHPSIATICNNGREIMEWRSPHDIRMLPSGTIGSLIIPLLSFSYSLLPLSTFLLSC
jgi:hypothetical protein